ncbi:hypothetical protein [Streptomyces sp. NPDC001530]|uniref:hypothetical protein n=1 Tax=Streptomyces sp. NPDC001530 TaxID=3364582 RepID=UPI00367A7978
MDANGLTSSTTQHPTPIPAALDAVSLTALRAPAVRHLLALQAEGRLTRGHVHTVAQCLAVSDRTVWRWLAKATASPDAAACPGARSSARFEITAQIRVLLAYWRGNASAVHRELVARARAVPLAEAESGTPEPAWVLPTATTAIPGGGPATGCAGAGSGAVAVDVLARCPPGSHSGGAGRVP